MINDIIRVFFLVLSGLTLVLVATWYIIFCIEEITGTGRVVIDPLTVISDDGKSGDELGTALAQMLQADLESHASEFQNAQYELAMTYSSSSSDPKETLPDPRSTEVVGNVRGWTPDVPLKIFLLKPLNTGLLQPVDMKFTVGGLDVGGILPWMQRRISSRRTLHFTFYSHGDGVEVFGSIDALRIRGPGIRLVVNGEDGKPPSLRRAVDRLAYEIFRRKLASDANTKVNLLKPEEFVSLTSVVVKAGDANRLSIGGRPAKEEFGSILPIVKMLCDSVPKWPELEYFAGWIADKNSDPLTAIEYYQRVLAQSDRNKNPDLVSYLDSHIAELNQDALADESTASVSAGVRGWSIDYTQFVRAIRDGGAEGSVVGEALATAMEMQIKRTLHQGIKISARHIYYAARQLEGSAGVDAGARIETAIKVLEKQGTVEDDIWPYKAGEYATKPPVAVASAARWQITQVKPLHSLEEIMKALASDGPVVAGIELYQEAMSNQTAKTGVIQFPKKKSQLIGGHAVVLIAYDAQKKQFKFANNWGAGWGDQGYGYISEQYIKEHSTDCWSFRGVSRSSR
jgi:hypothetical protein